MTAIASTLTSDQPLRVLTPTLKQRLEAATAAQRELKLLGYHVHHQDLRLVSDKRPLLTVANGDENLRSRLRQIAIRSVDGSRAVIGRFLDVDLCLPQRQH